MGDEKRAANFIKDIPLSRSLDFRTFLSVSSQKYKRRSFLPSVYKAQERLPREGIWSLVLTARCMPDSHTPGVVHLTGTSALLGHFIQ